METMISTQRALELIHEHVCVMEPVLLPLEEAFGLTLAEDVTSSVDVPSFVQSNMDGYAFAFEVGATSYVLAGEVAAGQFPDMTLERGQAVRIFTGSPLPYGADTVVMQEKVQVISDQLLLPEEGILKGEHVRQPGSEIASGTVVLEKGSIISPAAAGILASVGENRVKVYPRPLVGILVTGNELQKPGQKLEKGQIYESNSYTLVAALQQLHIKTVITYAHDAPEEIEKQIRYLLKGNDMVLITGGVSVGTYDFTWEALERCGVKTIFHRVRQKPGKPLLFGMKDAIPVFGLPGNPGSVLTCFYEYVRPAIQTLTNQNCLLQEIVAPTAQDIVTPVGLTCYLKGYYNGETVIPLSGQESYKVSPYARANCLIVVPEQSPGIAAGSPVSIHLIP